MNNLTSFGILIKFSDFVRIFCNSEILRKCLHFLKMFVKFRQNFIKISKKNTNFNAFFMKFELNKLFNLFKNDKIVTTFLLKF